MAEPLLATKLHIPAARAGEVARPRLMARLDEGRARKVTLVSAPAGFGKTTLISAWLRDSGYRVAWLTLEPADNDPVRFLRYLVAALREAAPDVGREAEASLTAAQSPSPELIVTGLVNQLAGLCEDLFLVLDDYQNIDDETVHKAVRDLAAYAPDCLHLVISTREDPPLPLARLRARGDLVELRGHDLRFDPVEAAVFFERTMGLALSPEDVEALERKVEGWAAGLQLAALSVRDREHRGQFIASLGGGDHYILSYLTEEVLQGQPPEIQSFLLETSILDRLTGPLCDAVTGRSGSAATLERLYAANLFVLPLDQTHQTYRYHFLFADLLRSRLRRTDPDAPPVLHRRASEWCAANGRPSEAIGHALEGGDFQRAVALLEDSAWPAVLAGRWKTLERWLESLPAQYREAGPRSNLALAWSLTLRGRLAEADAHAREAERAAGAGDAVRLEALCLRAVGSAIRGDLEPALEMAREAASRAADAGDLLQGTALFALATVLNYGGRIPEAIEAYRRALPLCQAAGNTLATSLIVGNLGLLHLVSGELRSVIELCDRISGSQEREVSPALPPAVAPVRGILVEVRFERGDRGALEEVERSVDLSARSGHVAAMTFGCTLLSRARQAAGDLGGAGKALEEAGRLLRYPMPGWVAPEVVSQSVSLALALGDEGRASAALAATGVSPAADVSYHNEVLLLAHLRLLLHQGSRPRRDAWAHAAGPGLPPDQAQRPVLDQALDLADRIAVAAGSAGRNGRLIEALVLRALVRQARGEIPESLDDLERALRMGEPEGYLRVFTGEGQPMAALLRSLRDRGRMAAYAERILAAFPALAPVGLAGTGLSGTSTPSGQPGLIEPLTERELEILILMAEGLTYQEMAERLIVSLNTVRFHVKSLYGKLGAHSRTLAVERARGLGLL